MREQLYAGELLFLPQQPRFLEYLRTQLRSVFGQEYRLPCPDFLAQLGMARELLRSEATRQETISFLENLGLPSSEYCIDYLRLRGVAPGAEKIPAAAPAFYAHRDTWYANPDCQINLWMPLHDVTPENSFAFYPDYFSKPVVNDSERFEYENFAREIGFQGTRSSKEAVYPRLTEELSCPAGFSLGAGEVLAFAAAHLHQTLPNRTSLTRFSVDLRIVHRADLAAGLGAPNVDNRSVGNAMLDYPW